MLIDSEMVSCPYCGESIELAIEPMDSVQTYYEDCQVCCQPIFVQLTPDPLGSKPNLRCFRADETP